MQNNSRLSPGPSRILQTPFFFLLSVFLIGVGTAILLFFRIQATLLNLAIVLAAIFLIVGGIAWTSRRAGS